MDHTKVNNCTYHDILRRLEMSYDKGEARALARLVLEERFSLSLVDIMCDKLDTMSREDCEELDSIISRLERHEPVQYILGYQDFCGHRFRVEPGVLIPRPETEELVHLLTQSLLPTSPRGGENLKSRADNEPLRVLDIGTGSGCIAISIALAAKANQKTPPLDEGPACWGRSGMVGRGLQVEAWDISDDALRIAKDNAERLGAHVIFRKVDVLNEQSILTNSPFGGRGAGRWSAIVSNPPYICQHEAAGMDRNVLDHEPHLALFVPDDDPLLFYRAIASYAIKTLQQGGHLLFEINRAYGTEVCELLRGLGYIHVQLFNDQYDNPRVVQAEKRL